MKNSIRFPMHKERTGYRKGPRFRKTINCSGLSGVAACAAHMICSAILYRDERPAVPVKAELSKRIARLGMRSSALWARVFAGHISEDDPRIDAANAQRAALVRQYCASAVGGTP